MYKKLLETFTSHFKATSRPLEFGASLFPPFRATGTLGCGLSTLVGSSGRYLGVVLVRFTLARPEHAVANAAITDKYDCRQEHDGTDSAWLPFQEEPDQV